MLRKLLFLFLLGAPAWSQMLVEYIASTGNVVLNSSTTAATLQQPGTNALNVGFSKAQAGGIAPAGATVYCSVACVATLSRNCTVPASATASTPVQINPTDPPPVVTFYTASNASSCTALETINVQAGVWQGIDLSYFAMVKGGTTSNLTISISSITGTANITFFPVEQH